MKILLSVLFSVSVHAALLAESAPLLDSTSSAPVEISNPPSTDINDPVGKPKALVPTKSTGAMVPLNVKEGTRELRVRSSAPIPTDVQNETQARALSREAAVVRGQTAFLTFVLDKPARSKRKLSEVEIPSLELQEKIRGYVKGAKVVRTEWTPKDCVVDLALDKKFLKELIRKN